MKGISQRTEFSTGLIWYSAVAVNKSKTKNIYTPKPIQVHVYGFISDCSLLSAKFPCTKFL